MKAYFLALFQASIINAGRGAAAAGDANLPLKDMGIAAGAAGLAGILGFILSHPTTTPAALATVSAVTPPILSITQTAPTTAQ